MNSSKHSATEASSTEHSATEPRRQPPLTVIEADADAAAATVAQRTLEVLQGVQAERPLARLAITGGRMGIAVLCALGEHPQRGLVDWSRVHIFWGDERWLPEGDPERNDEQARAVFLEALNIPSEHQFRFAHSEQGLSLSEAAEAFAQKQDEWRGASDSSCFDLLFLGVGPDGHIASMFPDRPDLTQATEAVVAVTESPKPPAERLSLSIPMLNRADRVWLFVTGEEKRDAFAAACATGAASGAVDSAVLPAAMVRGRVETIIFADAAAAALPESAG